LQYDIVPDIESKLRYRFKIECAKSVEFEYRTYISKIFLRCRSQKLQYRSQKLQYRRWQRTSFFYRYRTLYRIRHRCIYMILNSVTGPSVRHLPSRDSGEEREIDFDDHREYMDQEIPPGQFPGPNHRFLSGMPDWMNITQEDLSLALQSLPIPLQGLILPGISLQEAIQVNQRHNVHQRQHQNIVRHNNRYTMSYTDIVHNMGIIMTDKRTKLHFKSPTAERRQVLCVRVGGV
jgi:hypothetical protein